jgi:glycogen debranching enzyme
VNALEVIEVENQYYIHAKSSLADDRTRVLKHGDTFAVFDRYGDIQPVGLGEQGIYHEETRFVSKLSLNLDGKRPLLLSSAVREDNLLLAVDLTNPDTYFDGQLFPRGSLHIYRSKFLWEGVCYERVQIRNYGLLRAEVSFALRFDADFADIFEVRGQKRERKGQRLADSVEKGGAVLSYQGLDGVVRRTWLQCTPQPRQITGSEMRFDVHLDPKELAEILITIACEAGGAVSKPGSYDGALAEAGRAANNQQTAECSIYTSNEQFNDWLNRSTADLQTMITPTPHGLYPYAGVPWFSTVFGRDGIITALEYLWVDPEIAKGVLACLACTQATETNHEQDAEPGKILHENRKGEMALLGEVPFRRYYGSVDATPLFVMLAGAYYERTGDLQFLGSIWPNIEQALQWIDRYGDADGDGFVEYYRRSPKGLVHQGWKDSQDSVFHADGGLADGPMALCEVQGYVYAAKRGIAQLAAALGRREQAEELARQAAVLQERFERAFWCEELSTYVIALDGQKRPCKVRTSNAGQCLFTGIAGEDHARRTAETLMSSDSFSGWGVRTVGASEPRFNPMSYHNGSIWPHDNALIASGLARYGFKEFAAKILTGLFDASIFLDLHRLPELFCGFVRHTGKSPTQYPVACAPQSWAAASVFLLLQACLGLSIRALEERVCFLHPLLPESLQEVQIKNLRVGQASVDLFLERYHSVVGINVTRRDGPAEILAIT